MSSEETRTAYKHEKALTKRASCRGIFFACGGPQTQNTVLWATDNAIVRGCMACGAETMHVSGQARVDDRTLGLTLCQCSVGGTKHATSLGPREGAHRGAARLLGRESTLVASRPVEPSALCAGAWIVY